MKTIEEVYTLLRQNSPSVDSSPILLPSRQLAQVIAGFANSGGGHLLIGVKRKAVGDAEVLGLSTDFNVSAMTNKALDLLVPKPPVTYGFHQLQDQQVFLLNITNSENEILLQGKKFVRDGHRTVDSDEQIFYFNPSGEIKIKELAQKLQVYSVKMTDAKSRVIAHYQAALKILDNLAKLLYPDGLSSPTSSHEGKILTRILYSSMVDNFEIYLSDILYAIYLANPNTLKSSATVTLEQVLNCSDIEDFIQFYAKDKIARMKRGSVKTFIKDNKLIADLNIFTKQRIDDVETVLQIRHLYAHSNGLIDEHFLKFYRGSLTVGDEYLLTTGDILEKLDYLSELIELTDNAAIDKHNISTL